MKAMIFAAGLGTRLQPLTNNTPKALVPIAGVTLLEHTINKLTQYGVDDIVVNVHHFSDQIIKFLQEKNNFGVNIRISDEREKLLNTGGAIKYTKPLLGDKQSFIIHNVDVFTNIDLESLYKEHCDDKGRLASLVVSKRDTNRYLLFNEDNELEGWINEKTAETKPYKNMDASKYQKFAFAGVQVVSPAIFDLMEDFGDEFSIIDFYLRLSQTQRIVAYTQDDLEMIDVGKIDVIEEAEKFILSTKKPTP